MKSILVLALLAVSTMTSFAQNYVPFNEKATYVLGKETIWDLDFNHDGSEVVCASSHNRIFFWDPSTGEVTKSNKISEMALFGANYSADEKHVVAGGWKGGIYVVDAKSGEVAKQFGDNFSINELETHPTKPWVLVAGSEKYPGPDFLRAYNYETGEVAVTFYEGNGSQAFPSAMSWSPDGKKVACGMANKEQGMRMYDGETGEELLKKSTDFEPSGMDWSSDGKYIVTGGTDEQVKLWDPTSLSLLWTAPWNDGICTAVEFSPNSNYIAAGGRGYEGHHVRIYQTEDGETMQSIGERNPVINSVAWSPDGNAVALAATVYGDFADAAIARVYKNPNFSVLAETTTHGDISPEDETAEEENATEESQVDWYKYTNKKAKLEALLPKEPKTDEATKDKNGRTKYKVESTTSNAYALIIVTAIEKKVPKDKQLELAAAVAKNFLKAMGVDAESTGGVESPDGLHGAQMVFYKDGLRYRYVSYVKGQKSYQAIYMTKNKSADAAEEEFVRKVRPM